MNDNFQITAKCLSGMEPILANELETLGAKGIQTQTRAVFFEGDESMLYKANLHLRTALRILKPIESFYTHDFAKTLNILKSSCNT